MNFTALAAAALGLAVALGAFGAHGLRSRLDAYQMGLWEKAVFYHFVHALGMLVVSALPKAGLLSRPAAFWICLLLAAGVVLFSGSLYVLAVSGIRTLGALAPVGGLAWIVGWVLLAWAAAAQSSH
ncbi:MAG TPA: DUF423 domain-containing protein [Bryobacteraceae bacterium]|nr:DUF423 domain-containing protein [Bryobacteraceae bacterium]